MRLKWIKEKYEFLNSRVFFLLSYIYIKKKELQHQNRYLSLMVSLIIQYAYNNNVFIDKQINGEKRDMIVHDYLIRL
jgi:hypothetical protein